MATMDELDPPFPRTVGFGDYLKSNPNAPHDFDAATFKERMDRVAGFLDPETTRRVQALHEARDASDVVTRSRVDRAKRSGPDAGTAELVLRKAEEALREAVALTRSNLRVIHGDLA